MQYDTSYIIRFEGTLTQGPNAGKSYSLESSWGGVDFLTVEEAKEKLAFYKSREPQLRYKLLSRQYVQTSKRKGHFEEKEIAI